MMDKAKISAKSSEAKKSNTVSQTQKTASFQSTGSPVDQILFLQRTIGNQAVQRLLKGTGFRGQGIGLGVQAKLRIGQPNDVYEQEADRVADTVMRMPEPAIQMKPGWSGKSPSCGDEEIIQTKEIAGQTPEVTPNIESRINAIKGGGQPLPQSTRSYFEPRFGYDFSKVRVHTSNDAVQMSRELNAEAFTLGRDIYFRAGRYNPGTSLCRNLLAHELTHVVQQTQIKTPDIQRQEGAGGGGAAAPASHRFADEGVDVVVRPSCAPTVFGFANVETAIRTALNAIFNTDCIEESRRTRIQRNLRSHGLDIRCRRSANLETPGACAESTGFSIPANIFTLGSRSFPKHPNSLADCQPLESTILHEIVHLTRGFAEEALPASCEASCFGAGGGNPDLCRNIDVFGRRIGGP